MLTNSDKAIGAAILAALVSLQAHLHDKTSFTDMTPLQWVTIALAAIITGLGVWVVPNKPGL